MDRDVETQLGDDRLDGLGLLGHRFAKLDRQIGPEDGQHHARHSAAGADVEHAVAGVEELFERLAVDDVAAGEFFVGGVPRQIELFVPIPEQPAVAVEVLDLVGGQVDLVPGQGGGQRVVFGLVALGLVECVVQGSFCTPKVWGGDCLSHYAPTTPTKSGEFGKNVTVLTIFWIGATLPADTSSCVGAASALKPCAVEPTGGVRALRNAERRPATPRLGCWEGNHHVETTCVFGFRGDPANAQQRLLPHELRQLLA